jgi:secondary thiamine-phosphate synthase enzyme
VTIVHADSFEVRLDVGPDMADVTSRITDVVRDSGVDTGQASLCVVGSTGSITTIEYEPGAVSDLKRAIERLAPRDGAYAHEEAWHDGNGHSHVQAALMGPSLVLAVRGGRPVLGTWQQAVVVNHDNKARSRRVEITVTGLGPRRGDRLDPDRRRA